MSKFMLESQAGQLHGDILTQDVTLSGTGPTALPASALAKRKHLYLQNKTGVSVWIGNSSVTQYTGIEVIDGGVWRESLGRATLYAITAGTTVSGIRIMEIA